MAVYTVNMVEKYLRMYQDIRFTLEGNCQRLPDTYTLRTKPKRNLTRQPFGQTATGEPWPFMEPKHAKPPMDGKRNAQLMEDLHTAVLDIESAFPRLSEDDQQLIYDYHITQNKNLDEIAVERNVSSRGSMCQRIARAVQRLTREMENGNGYERTSPKRS